MKSGWLIATVVALAGAVPAVADPATEARFKALYTAEWAWRQRIAEVDDDESQGVRAKLPDVSPAAQAARLTMWETTRTALNGIDAAKLTPESATNRTIYESQLDTLIASQRFREYEAPANSDTSFWSGVAQTGRRNFRSERELRNWIAQMRDLPRFFAQSTVNMQAGLVRGFTPPAVTMQGRDAGVVVIAEATDPAATAYYEPFKAMPASIPAATQAALQGEARAVIRDAVIPAHRDLLAFLRGTYLPGLRTSIAAHDLPDGLAFYRAQIKGFTTLDLDAEAVHAIGLREVAKIRAEMLGVMAETGFKGDLPAFLKMLRTDPRFYARTPDELLKEAAWISKRFDGVADRWFGRLPRGRFAIVEVPPEIAPFYTAGRGGSGKYWLNTYDLPARPLFQLTALTLHESAPGHAFQGALASENEGQPAFRSKTYISAYGEGWALYTERLGVEMGMYATPYDRFGMLSYQMWRAVRLVVDTGMHAKGWSRDRALAYLRDNTALSEREVTTEIDRYIGWPGQALSYYLGQLAIVRARAKAEVALGPKFDIRAFHDTILALGSVPLPVLTARLDRFIAEGGKGPYPLK